MYIGEAAKITGASIKAIRLYHELGLLPDVTYSGRYRIFSQRDVRFITLIKQAQGVGFTLAELKQALDTKGKDTSWQRMLGVLVTKGESLERDIESLQRKREHLAQYEKSIRQCIADDPDCDLVK